MTNEELILEKLERLENQIAPIIKTTQVMTELKNDLTPIGNHAVKLLVNELHEIEEGFQLEDAMALTKEAMRNTGNFVFLLKQMSSMIEFVKDMEPLLKSAVPRMISILDDMETKGVFRMYRTTNDLRKKIAASYTAEDIEVMGDGLVALMGTLKTLSDPKAIRLLKTLSQIPGNVEIEKAENVGVYGLASSAFDPEIKKGLGIMLEMAKAVGRIDPEAAKETA